MFSCVWLSFFVSASFCAIFFFFFLGLLCCFGLLRLSSSVFFPFAFGTLKPIEEWRFAENTNRNYKKCIFFFGKRKLAFPFSKSIEINVIIVVNNVHKTIEQNKTLTCDEKSIAMEETKKKTVNFLMHNQPWCDTKHVNSSSLLYNGERKTKRKSSRKNVSVRETFSRERAINHWGWRMK